MRNAITSLLDRLDSWVTDTDDRQFVCRAGIVLLFVVCIVGIVMGLLAYLLFSWVKE